MNLLERLSRRILEFVSVPSGVGNFKRSLYLVWKGFGFVCLIGRNSALVEKPRCCLSIITTVNGVHKRTCVLLRNF